MISNLFRCTNSTFALQWHILAVGRWVDRTPFGRDRLWNNHVYSWTVFASWTNCQNDSGLENSNWSKFPPKNFNLSGTSSTFHLCTPWFSCSSCTRFVKKVHFTFLLPLYHICWKGTFHCLFKLFRFIAQMLFPWSISLMVCLFVCLFVFVVFFLSLSCVAIRFQRLTPSYQDSHRKCSTCLAIGDAGSYQSLIYKTQNVTQFDSSFK